jgi:predicted exporter
MYISGEATDSALNGFVEGAYNAGQRSAWQVLSHVHNVLSIRLNLFIFCFLMMVDLPTNSTFSLFCCIVQLHSQTPSYIHPHHNRRRR